MTDKKNDDLANLSGAYVLNALSAEEALAFEKHIAESDSTRYEVTELRDTAVLLGMAVTPVAPPASLKANIMSMIAETPQLPREVPAVAPAAPAVPEQRPVADFAPKAEAKAKARWFARPAVILTSMAAAIALIAGGIVAGTGIADSNFTRNQADQLAAINSADDMQQSVADVSGGGTATLVWSNELESAALIVDGVTVLPSDKVYELWYINEAGARAAGTFTAHDEGDAWRVLDGEMQAGDTIGVTVEPAGGSEQPTTDPVLALATDV